MNEAAEAKSCGTILNEPYDLEENNDFNEPRTSHGRSSVLSTNSLDSNKLDEDSLNRETSFTSIELVSTSRKRHSNSATGDSNGQDQTELRLTHTALSGRKEIRIANGTLEMYLYMHSICSSPCTSSLSLI